MPPPDTPRTYHSLREQVQQILSEGRIQSRQATEWEKVETYWHIGHALYAHILDRDGRAEYGQQIIASLSEDMNMAEVLLYDILRFRKTFPVLHPRAHLAWTHYRMLTHLPTIEQRCFYERRADEDAWSTRELERQIKAGLYRHTRDRPDALPVGKDPFDGRPFLSRRGNLYTYVIRKPPRSNACIANLRLDFGFHMHWKVEFKGIPEPRDGMIVTSAKHGSGPTADFQFQENPKQRRSLYTYIARYVHVIDGDTLQAVADCGFGLTTPQKFRLRGIDTPELSTRAGLRAREFVRERLNAVDFVVLTTARAGKFGRYLADIFYHPGEADPEVVLRKGKFLNRQLLQERLATRYPRR